MLDAPQRLVRTGVRIADQYPAVADIIYLVGHVLQVIAVQIMYVLVFQRPALIWERIVGQYLMVAEAPWIVVHVLDIIHVVGVGPLIGAGVQQLRAVLQVRIVGIFQMVVERICIVGLVHHQAIAVQIMYVLVFQRPALIWERIVGQYLMGAEAPWIVVHVLDIIHVVGVGPLIGVDVQQLPAVLQIRIVGIFPMVVEQIYIVGHAQGIIVAEAGAQPMFVVVHLIVLIINAIKMTLRVIVDSNA